MQPRCGLRVPVGYPASIQSDTGAGEGVLLDLWPTGCRMRSNIALDTGAYLALQIAISQERTPLAVEVSVVRWCKDGHFGVEFLRYSQGDRERVTDLVEALPSMEISALPDYATPTLCAVGSLSLRPSLLNRISQAKIIPTANDEIRGTDEEDSHRSSAMPK